LTAAKPGTALEKGGSVPVVLKMTRSAKIERVEPAVRVRADDTIE